MSFFNGLQTLQARNLFFFLLGGSQFALAGSGSADPLNPDPIWFRLRIRKIGVKHAKCVNMCVKRNMRTVTIRVWGISSCCFDSVTIWMCLESFCKASIFFQQARYGKVTSMPAQQLKNRKFRNWYLDCLELVEAYWYLDCIKVYNAC
jgi:hypothetical protein